MSFAQNFSVTAILDRMFLKIFYKYTRIRRGSGKNFDEFESEMRTQDFLQPVTSHNWTSHNICERTFPRLAGLKNTEKIWLQSFLIFLQNLSVHG